MSDNLKRIKEEIAIIQAQYKRETDKFVAQVLKKYPEYFTVKIKEKKPKTERKNRRWTNKEIEMLIENYERCTNAELAQMVGHTKGSVGAKKCELGLVKDDAKKEVQTVNRSSITNATRTLICGSVVRGESLEQIAKDTQRPIKVIERVLGECRQSGMYKKVEDYVKGVY